MSRGVVYCGFAEPSTDSVCACKGRGGCVLYLRSEGLAIRSGVYRGETEGSRNGQIGSCCRHGYGDIVIADWCCSLLDRIAMCGEAKAKDDREKKEHCIGNPQVGSVLSESEKTGRSLLFIYGFTMMDVEKHIRSRLPSVLRAILSCVLSLYEDTVRMLATMPRFTPRSPTKRF